MPMPADMNTNAYLVDKEKVAQLRELMGERYDGIKASFLGHVQEYTALIGAVMDENDRNELEQVAHKLRSVSVQFGMPELAHKAKEIELSAANGSIEELRLLYTDMQQIAIASAKAYKALDISL